MIAPTTAIASRALVSDISGVCSSGETRRITSNPMNAASIKTYKLANKSNFIGSGSLRLHNKRRQSQILADPRVHDFAVSRQQRLPVNLICLIELQVSVLHQIQQKCREVASIHLARVIRNSGRQIELPDNRYAMFHDGFAAARQFAISATLRGKIHNPVSSPHPYHHLFRDQNW